MPCLRFVADDSTDGAADKLDFDGTFLVGTDYTIFVVEQTESSTPYYFLGTTNGSPTSNTAVQFGYPFDNTSIRVSHGDMTGEFYMFTVPTSSRVPILHTFVNSAIKSGTNTINHYFNGRSTADSPLAATGSKPGTLTSYPNASIGVNAFDSNLSYYYSGDLGKMIFFTRVLKIEERTAVEAYLLKKWGIPKAT